MNETLPHNALEGESALSRFATESSASAWGKLDASLVTRNEPLVAVMLPTYNEAANIEKLIREIQALNLNLMLVIIDDSSPDGTADIVRRLQKEYENIILFVRPAKLGLGTAITAGFRLLLSLENPPRYIIAMDSDYSHNPKDIPRLVNAAKQGNHLVIGSRYITGGKT
ncbi:MAG: glycosyltransferase, partial [Candidatus Bathyarchaeales archaeon]